MIATRPAIGSQDVKPSKLNEQLFTVAEVASHLKFDESTIYEWCREGVIRAERHGKNDRNIRISASALEEYKRQALRNHG